MFLSFFTSLILSFFSTQAHAIEIQLLPTDLGAKKVSEYSYHFPDSRPNMMQFVSYRIHNNSDTPIKITDFWVAGAFFDATSNCPTTMSPKEKCNLEIRYWPPYSGFHSGRVGMNFDDDQNLLFHLSGWCRE